MNYWLRIIMLMLFDSVLINLSIYISLWLRFEGDIEAQYLTAFINLIPWITIITLASLYFFKLYHRMWQYASTGELYGIVKAVTTSMLLIIGLIYTIPLPHLPRSVYILSWLLMIAFIGGSRLAWRIVRDNIIKEAGEQGKKTLIIGAGDAGAMFARELINNKELALMPVGFIDDSRYKQKLTLYGIPVLGKRRDIPRIVDEYGVEEIIIAMPSVSGNTVKEFVDICRETPAKLRIFQGTSEILNSRQIREIELEDLLRREPVKLNLAEIAGYLTNQVIMVSGAGGSIGSELCRQICTYRPKTLVLVEYSENNLFDIETELRETFPDIHIEAELCDVKDWLKLQEVFQRSRPAVVFHAAAYKHVPMMEKHPQEAVKNNILGTRNMAQMADKHSTKTFIQISTDKAVNPSSVMGASKRIAEMLIQDINQRSTTNFAAVRFGNVLGSRGSVVPIFKKQIEKGGPVTVTHPNMTRYFMTIPEAVQLVIQAGAMAAGGEIFVLDMGEPVKIVDLARDLITLYGYEAGSDIQVKFTGIRPGEKLYEELFTAREQMAATRHERIFQSEQEKPYNNIYELIDRLFAQNVFLNRNDVVELIKQVLPEYHYVVQSDRCSKSKESGI